MSPFVVQPDSTPRSVDHVLVNTLKTRQSTDVGSRMAMVTIRDTTLSPSHHWTMLTVAIRRSRARIWHRDATRRGPSVLLSEPSYLHLLQAKVPRVHPHLPILSIHPPSDHPPKTIEQSRRGQDRQCIRCNLFTCHRQKGHPDNGSGDSTVDETGTRISQIQIPARLVYDCAKAQTGGSTVWTYRMADKMLGLSGESVHSGTGRDVE